MKPLRRELEALRPEMAKAFQKVYDEWTQDEEGIDEELGTGGICDLVSEAIGSALSEHLGDVSFFCGGAEGDDHAWMIVQRAKEAYGVDISPGVYESGGGYRWKKREGIVLGPADIEIFPVDPLPEEPE